MTPLIIAADDFAQSAAIDRGILSLVAQSHLSAFSCLVLSPRWPEASAAITRDIRSRADVGLHLDFTQYPQAMRASLPRLIVSASLRSLSRQAIRAAIETQCNRFEDALGTAPDYVDGHQHVHQLPQIRDVLIEVLSRRYRHHLPWLRIARPNVADGSKAAIIGMLGSEALARLARRHGFRHTTRLLGVYDFKGSASDYRQRLAGWLAQANAERGCALMCHPAVETSATSEQHTDPIHAARVNEYRILSNAQLPGLLAAYGVTPGRGDQL